MIVSFQSLQRYGLWMVLLALLAGCESTTILFEVESESDANQGNTLKMLIRTIDANTYLTETYADVSKKVYESDPAILHVDTVFPGEYYWVEIPKPEAEQRIAVYFLFREPGDRWKTIIKQPWPDDVYFELSSNQIRSQE